jgi:hypothetical protein
LINATGCLAWEESKLGCSEEERRRVLEPELVSNDMEANNNKPEHLYGPWESERVNKLTSGNYKAVESE